MATGFGDAIGGDASGKKQAKGASIRYVVPRLVGDTIHNRLPNDNSDCIHTSPVLERATLVISRNSYSRLYKNVAMNDHLV